MLAVRTFGVHGKLLKSVVPLLGKEEKSNNTETANTMELILNRRAIEMEYIKKTNVSFMMPFFLKKSIQ